jgi:putative flippase GtrA
MKVKANRPIGFTLVSATCLLVHNLVMIVADAAGSPLWGAVLASYGIVVLIGYAGHSFLTFAQPVSIGRFARYAFAMAANIPSAFIFVWLAKNLGGLPMVFAAPLATVCSLALNYLLARWAINPGRVIAE